MFIVTPTRFNKYDCYVITNKTWYHLGPVFTWIKAFPTLIDILLSKISGKIRFSKVCW